MICPQCQKPVADASVSCAVCGSPTGSQNVQSGTIHAAASGVARSQAGVELPEWRRELARRLQRIKEKREAAIPIEESLSNIPSLPLKTEKRFEPRPPAHRLNLWFERGGPPGNLFVTTPWHPRPWKKAGRKLWKLFPPTK